MNADDSPVAGEVQVRPVQYLVAVWPDGHDCGEATLWCLLVTYRWHGRWAVEQGQGYSDEKIVLTRSGQWEYDRPGDPGYRFSRQEALDLAREHLPATPPKETPCYACNDSASHGRHRAVDGAPVRHRCLHRVRRRPGGRGHRARPALRQLGPGGGGADPGVGLVLHRLPRPAGPGGGAAVPRLRGSSRPRSHASAALALHRSGRRSGAGSGTVAGVPGAAR